MRQYRHRRRQGEKPVEKEAAEKAITESSMNTEKEIDRP